MKPLLPLGDTRRIRVACLIAVGLVASSALAIARDEGDDADLLKEARSHFEPLPKDMATPEFPVSPERVQLGRKLFFDPRISSDGAVSCSRCHLPALNATDALPKSLGVHDQSLPRNAPTVLNAGLAFKQHWDGRFANVEEQAKRSLLGPGFGNPDYATAMARIKAIPGYAPCSWQPSPARPIPSQKTTGPRPSALTSERSSRPPGSTTTFEASPTPSRRPNATASGRSSTPAVSTATKGQDSAASASASSA